MKEPRRAHMVRVYDEAMFARLRVRAAEEGRTVGAVVENALRLYLGSVGAPEIVLPTAPPPPVQARTMAELERTETFQSLRELIRSVPALPPGKPEGRVETLREKLEREAAAREWLRSHPEEEGQ